MHWKDQGGRNRHGEVNLDNISSSGVCLEVQYPVPLGTKLQVCHSNGELTGTVKYCVRRDFGYFLGVELDAGCRWSEDSFRPLHLLNPHRLG
jgi:hypothetical protein